jgi:hypothetical protein
MSAAAEAGDMPLADLLAEFWSMAGEPDSGDCPAAGSAARFTAGSGGEVLGRLGLSGIMVDGVDAADLLRTAYRIFAAPC